MERGECLAPSIFTRSSFREKPELLAATDSIWGLHLRTAVVGATDTGSVCPCSRERSALHFRSSVSLGTVERICLLSPSWLLYPSLQTSLLDPASLKHTFLLIRVLTVGSFLCFPCPLKTTLSPGSWATSFLSLQGDQCWFLQITT